MCEIVSITLAIAAILCGHTITTITTPTQYQGNNSSLYL